MGCTSSDIFLVKAETHTYSGNFGIGCFNGGGGSEFNSRGGPQTFLDRYYTSSVETSCENAPPWASAQSSCNSQEKVIYDIQATKYGEVVNKEIYYSLESQKSLTEAEESLGTACGGCCPEGGTINASFKQIRKNGVVVENTINNCDGEGGTPAGCGDDTLYPGYRTETYCGDFYNTNCLNLSSQGQAAHHDEATECTTLSYSSTNPICNYTVEGDGFYTEKQFGSLRMPVDFDRLEPPVEEANGIKINILDQNSPQNDQGYNCGNEKTSCYSWPLPNVPHLYDTLYERTHSTDSYDIIRQKWRVKVAEKEDILIDDLSQRYQLYAYYHTGENPDLTTSPCCTICTGCFEGTIVAQKDIRLIYDNNYKKTTYYSDFTVNEEFILSSDYLEFDNYDYVGPSRNLYYCSKRIYTTP